MTMVSTRPRLARDRGHSEFPQAREAGSFPLAIVRVVAPTDGLEGGPNHGAIEVSSTTGGLAGATTTQNAAVDGDAAAADDDGGAEEYETTLLEAPSRKVTGCHGLSISVVASAGRWSYAVAQCAASTTQGLRRRAPPMSARLSAADGFWYRFLSSRRVSMTSYLDETTTAVFVIDIKNSERVIASAALSVGERRCRPLTFRWTFASADCPVGHRKLRAKSQNRVIPAEEYGVYRCEQLPSG
ncbi:MAG: hypothetical protein BJ554DRAFT_489 [Olpidium bornovanus]|uniref:Uncharacterized protein n=1 Tax=Olpidium bornovanus TaxID=278681 RepID=A0A8H7ZTP2_9FUNG|nr:MAG: hypothetical protein BJ554DRAFT_489 [Olpidium bornovanus]